MYARKGCLFEKVGLVGYGANRQKEMIRVRGKKNILTELLII
jgi:hypothetical protein